ncbi:MAG: hypothetical protein GY752_10665 [bacterium]|nr:hypothetical protein [bacterium]MCP4798663.1 hypothetical protein [bacterium]
MSKWLLLIALGLIISGCGQGNVQFPYPDEHSNYPVPGNGMPKIYLAGIVDVRPVEQKRGEGIFLDLTFPSDRKWSEPVDAMYRQALSQDITQTSLAVLVEDPLEADYKLEAEIFSFACSLDRFIGSFAMPALAGGVVGVVWGGDGNSMLKRGLFSWAIAMLAIPLPVEFQAQAEVRLTMRDPEDKIVWRETCIGQINEGKWLPATSRSDKILAERKMPLALKRCNACLLGQLRQFLY